MCSISFRFRPERKNSFFKKLEAIGFSFHLLMPDGSIQNFLYEEGIDYVHPPEVYALWYDKPNSEIDEIIAELVKLHRKRVIEKLKINFN